MAKGGKNSIRSVKATKIETLERKVKEIERNFMKYKNDIYTKNEAFINKSRKSTTIFGVSQEMFDLMLETTKLKLKHAKKGDLYSKTLVKDFVDKFNVARYKNVMTAERGFIISQRNQYISKFEALGQDNDIFKALKQSGLWNSKDFWKSFFNSDIFAPLYKDYLTKDNSSSTYTWQKETKSKHTLWGDTIFSYAKYYISSHANKYDNNVKNMFKDAIEFKYMNDKLNEPL